MADEPIRKSSPELGIRPPEKPAVERVEPQEQEVAVETEPVEEPESAQEHAPAEPAVASTPVAAQRVQAPAPTKDFLTREIESVLEEDLTDLYLKLPASKQQAFVHKGEETAGKIRQLVSKAKVNAKKIFELIRDWLKMIPGVNKFFLEQEAKIKADKIMLAAEEAKRRGGEELA